MVQKNEAKHLENCQIVARNAVISTDTTTLKVPVQKQKENAEETFYIDRV